MYEYNQGMKDRLQMRLNDVDISECVRSIISHLPNHSYNLLVSADKSQVPQEGK